MNYVTINSKLQTLRSNMAAIRTVFGAGSHKYESRAPLSENEIERFEKAHNISLPADYRGFLMNVGNGGAGPFYGIFSLGHWDGKGQGEELFDASVIGEISEPFPYTDKWNDLSPEAECRYLAPINGALPICTMGCAQRLWLVVSGPERGNIWRDYRADQLGWFPDELPGSPRITFGQWYESWLDKITA